MSDEQLVKDWERLRTILKDYVEDILARQPEVAKGRGEFECYQSMAVFAEKFPDPEKRKEWLDKLAETTTGIDQAVKWASKKTRSLGERVERAIDERRERRRRRKEERGF